jgi:hypothetical protein
MCQLKFKAGYLSTVQNGLILAQAFGFGKSDEPTVTNAYDLL